MARKKKEVCWVVIAWVDEHQYRTVGACPQWETSREGRACVWLRRGTKTDVDKAQTYITHEHPKTGRVFTYSVDEKEPLARARKEVLS
jgi:hypothetical protein